MRSLFAQEGSTRDIGLASESGPSGREVWGTGDKDKRVSSRKINPQVSNSIGRCLIARSMGKPPMRKRRRNRRRKRRRRRSVSFPPKFTV